MNCATLTGNTLINKAQSKATSGNFTTSILGHFPQFLIMKDLLDKDTYVYQIKKKLSESSAPIKAM